MQRKNNTQPQSNKAEKKKSIFGVFVVVVGHKDTQCYRSKPKMQENQEKATLEKAQEHTNI